APPIPSPAPPIITTTNGGTTWTRQTSNGGSGNYLHAVACVSGTTTCTAVGRAGRLVSTTNLSTWTVQTSNTTNMLNSIYCSSATSCIATGQNGTGYTDNGAKGTATTG